MMYFPSTKNRLKLKKLDKNCIQSIISKENRRIVIFLRTRVWYFFGSFCFTETIISHWKLFFFGCFSVWWNGQRKNCQTDKTWWCGGQPRDQFSDETLWWHLTRIRNGSAGAGATCCWGNNVMFPARVQISFKISLSAAEIKLDLKMSSQGETTDLCF